MVCNNFDKKANELLVEFLPAVAPMALATPGLGSMATGLIGGLIAVLGTAGAIYTGLKNKEPQSAAVDQGTNKTEVQPVPSEQQPVTSPGVEKPGYVTPAQTPALIPTQPEIRPSIPDAASNAQQQPQTQTPQTIPAPIPTTGQSQATQPGIPQPPQTPSQAGQQTSGSLPVVVPPPSMSSYRSPYTKKPSIEAYPIDQQLGNINVPGTKTAYRDTFNLPAMKAFDVGINQPPVQQGEPQGDILNAPKSLRAKYQHRAENPNEYEGTKAFGGIANLFK